MIVDNMYNDKCVHPSDIFEHLPILSDYASKCEHVTEFGVRGIVSTWALLHGRPKTLISYDMHSPSNWGGNIQLVYDAALEIGVHYEFKLENVLDINIDPTDLLFIDTKHSYDQLKKELELHANNVRHWIILHDTHLYGQDGEGGGLGLRPALTEFLTTNTHWQIIYDVTNNNGLTILENHA